MCRIKSKVINGKKVESIELTEKQFNAACRLIERGVTKSTYDSLEDAMPYVNEWVENEDFDEEYRQWLRNAIDNGAEIYTYKDGWQPISEVAVWKY